MFAYQFDATMIYVDEDQDDSRRGRREAARQFYNKLFHFNQQNKQNFCFLSDATDGFLTGGIITRYEETMDDLLEDFLAQLDTPLKDVSLTEITLQDMQQLLHQADRGGFISDAEEVICRFQMDRVRNLGFGENVLEDTCRSEIYRNARRHLMEDTFLPELDRIHAGKPTVRPQGHPVHYMIQTDNVDIRRESFRLLLQALYTNGRLSSKRYSFLDFRPGDRFSQNALAALYRLSQGGAVVIRYLSNDNAEDEGVAGGERDTIERLSQVILACRNLALTILCLPRECKKAKEIFRENLGTMVFVEIREDLAGLEKSTAYLKRLASEHHIRSDKALLSQLEEGQTYLAADLQRIFDEWYSQKLLTTVFPQYKELSITRKEVAKSAPKGSAYDDLQDMVGLTEAKAVIQKALNYYKMQKLYEDKGMKADNPAMHMVFTGNPGTAKTTAARLFARIMRDNGLLSRGHLVEVGRGDLVGKYVGWTAQTVQKKFREAKGGVLFIDEAYSLTDDRTGSFGDEAINTIVQEMENHREELVVIFAGYPNEMERFLQRNPGLRSRIAFHVPFADYNTQELCQIAQLMAKKKGVQFETSAMEKLSTLFEEARQQSDFGNGRYVRNILEQAKMNQASRLLEYDFEDITTREIQTIKAEDIAIPEVKKEVKRTIGFAC